MRNKTSDTPRDKRSGLRLSSGRRLVSVLRSLCLFTSAALLCIPSTVWAAEGGAGLYLPGFYGDFQIAARPDRGLYYQNYLLYTRGNTDIALRQDRLHLDIEDRILTNMFGFLYVPGPKILGGQYHAALYVPLMYSKLDANVETGDVLRDTSASTGGLGDVYAIPFGLAWKKESLAFTFYQGVNVPVGQYDVNDPVNLGLDYWVFDTNVALTWTPQEVPFEVDVNLGYIINTTNAATDYRSGSSLHVDFTLGYDAFKHLSVALVGYGYRQVTGDSGNGARLGDFRGEAYGLGPALSYTFGKKTPIVLTTKWIHDLAATNRAKGDILFVNIGVPLWRPRQ